MWVCFAKLFKFTGHQGAKGCWERFKIPYSRQEDAHSTACLNMWSPLDTRTHTLPQWWLGKALLWNKFQLISGPVPCSLGLLLFMTSSLCYACKIFIELPVPRMQKTHVVLMHHLGLILHSLCKSSRPSQVVLSVPRPVVLHGKAYHQVVKHLWKWAGVSTPFLWDRGFTQRIIMPMGITLVLWKEAFAFKVMLSKNLGGFKEVVQFPKQQPHQLTQSPVCCLCVY